jgi:hypothetical protein
VPDLAAAAGVTHDAGADIAEHATSTAAATVGRRSILIAIALF